MAKRFTDSTKWNKPFIRGLEAPYKVLWLYIIDECDHAGIWQIDFEVARVKTGLNDISLDGALLAFGNKVLLFDNNEKLFIPDFIEFQYGELKDNNRVHESVIDRLKKYKINYKNKPLTSPLQRAKDKDKDKDKEIYREFKHLKITNNENTNLLNLGYNQQQIDGIYDAIENYKKNTNYVSLYLTAIKWLKNQYPTVSNVDKCPYTEIQIREVKAQMASGYGTPEWFDKKWESIL